MIQKIEVGKIRIQYATSKVAIMDQFFFSRGLSSILKELGIHKVVKNFKFLRSSSRINYSLNQNPTYLGRDLHIAHIELPYELKTL